MPAMSQYLIYFLIFSSAFFGLQVVIGMSKQASVKIRHANQKAKKSDTAKSPEELLIELRRDRGLSQDGKLKSINYKIGILVLQSGLPLGSYGIYFLMIAGGVLGAVGLYVLKASFVWAALGLAVGIVLPILFVRICLKRRRDKAVAQLPEALDVITRSLRAGHPVSVAMALVGREMADPIGSEFGVASDEVSFGRQVSAAIQRMSERIGHQDFDLFAAMIRLQERTGGNLAELLDASSKTVRDRQRMRLKIKAASSEGRASALILNAAPIALYFLIKISAPDFYGDVEDSEIVHYGLWGVVIWMFIGNLVMRRMINFKF